MPGFVCSVCYKQDALNRCSYCKKIYCGKTCQLEDWVENNHTLECKKHVLETKHDSIVFKAYGYMVGTTHHFELCANGNWFNFKTGNQGFSYTGGHPVRRSFEVADKAKWKPINTLPVPRGDEGISVFIYGNGWNYAYVMTELSEMFLKINDRLGEEPGGLSFVTCI